MRIRTYASALLVGGLALTGGLAAGPEESENGCRGVQEADDHAADQAQDALQSVKEIIDPDEHCENVPPASEQQGENGNRPSDEG